MATEGIAAGVDTAELEAKVKDMYRHVAEEPHGDYHFELGTPLAERLGYPAGIVGRIPEGAVESFAGVGYFFDLAERGAHRARAEGSRAGAPPRPPRPRRAARRARDLRRSPLRAVAARSGGRRPGTGLCRSR